MVGNVQEGIWFIEIGCIGNEYDGKLNELQGWGNAYSVVLLFAVGFCEWVQ